MTRATRFPRLGDFSERVQEVNASSPPGDLRELGRFRLAQANLLLDSLCAALTPESRAAGERCLKRVQDLLLDAYLMLALADQASRDDQALLKALQGPEGSGLPATERCRALPLAGWQLRHRDDVADGMAAAELSLALGAAASPWTALAEGRARKRGDRARSAFELGFLMHLYQRLMHAGAA